MVKPRPYQASTSLTCCSVWSKGCEQGAVWSVRTWHYYWIRLQFWHSQLDLLFTSNEPNTPHSKSKHPSRTDSISNKNRQTEDWSSGLMIWAKEWFFLFPSSMLLPKFCLIRCRHFYDVTCSHLERSSESVVAWFLRWFCLGFNLVRWLLWCLLWN